MPCSSFAAVRWESGSIAGRCACMIGSATNNIAEHSGMLSALADALQRNVQHAIFQADSLLVSRQVNCIWKFVSRIWKRITPAFR